VCYLCLTNVQHGKLTLNRTNCMLLTLTLELNDPLSNLKVRICTAVFVLYNMVLLDCWIY